MQPLCFGNMKEEIFKNFIIKMDVVKNFENKNASELVKYFWNINIIKI